MISFPMQEIPGYDNRFVHPVRVKSDKILDCIWYP